MSRTFRCKGFNFRGTRNSFDYEKEREQKIRARWKEHWEQQIGKTLRWIAKDYEDYEWLEIRWHKDKHSGHRNSVPSHFTKWNFYKPERAAMRNSLKKVPRFSDYEEVDIVTKQPKNMGWYYW